MYLAANLLKKAPCGGHPGDILNAYAFLLLRKGTNSIYRLRSGLLGSLILLAPHSFMPYRQMSFSPATSLLIELHISKNLTSTCAFLWTPSSFKLKSFYHLTFFLMSFLDRHFKPAAHALNRIFLQQLMFRYYRGGWHQDYPHLYEPRRLTYIPEGITLTRTIKFVPLAH